MASHFKQKPISSHHDDHDRDQEDEEDQNANNISVEKLKIVDDHSQAGSRKLLVLDLAGVLCDRVFHKNNANIPINRTPDAFNGSFFVYKRPYCEEFVKFCLEKFDVGIWSSAKRHNMESALDCVIGGFKSKLLFVWDQDDCTNSGFSTKENENKPIFFKELKKLWENNKYSNLPWSRGKYSSSNTLLIDDKPYKALLNPPHTAIFPSEYKPDQIDDATLGPNGELRNYLDGLAKAADVPAYVKEHSFGQAAITTIHPDWDFYSTRLSVLRARNQHRSREVMNR